MLAGPQRVTHTHDWEPNLTLCAPPRCPIKEEPFLADGDTHTRQSPVGTGRLILIGRRFWTRPSDRLARRAPGGVTLRGGGGSRAGGTRRLWRNAGQRLEASPPSLLSPSFGRKLITPTTFLLTGGKPLSRHLHLRSGWFHCAGTCCSDAMKAKAAVMLLND